MLDIMMGPKKSRHLPVKESQWLDSGLNLLGPGQQNLRRFYTDILLYTLKARASIVFANPPKAFVARRWTSGSA